MDFLASWFTPAVAPEITPADIVDRFLSDANVRAVRARVVASDSELIEFAKSIQHDLTGLEIDRTANIGDIISSYTDAFVSSRHRESPVEPYAIGEYGQQTLQVADQRDADAILAQWIDAPKRFLSPRDDHPADGRPVWGSDRAMIEYSTGNVDELGQDYHVHAFETPMMRALNANPSHAFGVGLGNAELLARPIFRDGNRIPVRERKLVSRHIDRDISETLTGVERGYMLQAHRPDELLSRIGKKYIRQSSTMN